MGRPEMTEKGQNLVTQGGGCRRVRRPDPGASGGAVKFYGQDRPVVAILPVRRMYSSGGRNRLPRLKPDRPKNGSKRPSSGFSGLLDFLLGFGVGSSLGTKN